MSRNETSNWDEILAIELCLGFKSREGHLLAHRQHKPLFKGLFAAVAKLHAEFAGLSALEISDNGHFQVRCDPIFDEWAPLLWEGPNALWLIKSSEKTKYGEGSNANCYWDTSSPSCKKHLRKYFHYLVALYLANTETVSDGGEVVIRCRDSQSIPLGREASAPSAQADRSPKTKAPRKRWSKQSAASGLTTGRPARRRKRPLSYDEEFGEEMSGSRRHTKNSQPKRPRLSCAKQRPHGSNQAPRDASNGRTDISNHEVAADSTSTGDADAPNRDDASTGPSNSTHTMSVDDDSLYQLTPPWPPPNNLSNTTDRPSSTSFAAALDLVGVGPSRARNSATAGIPPADACSGARFLGQDDDQDEEETISFKQEAGTKPGGAKSNPILLSDSEDEQPRPHSADRGRNHSHSRGPSRTCNTREHGRSSQQSYNNNSDVFAGGRAWVSWGPQAPYDSILDLADCLTAVELIGRVEQLKLKAPSAIKPRKIAAAGVKCKGQPCFRIPWDAEDCGPAFEELQELVRDKISDGERLDLKLDIEWDDKSGEAGRTGSAFVKQEGLDDGLRSFGDGD